MRKIYSWEVSDELWSRVEALIPAGAARAQGRKYHRRPGGGRKPLKPRAVFAAIVYVLRTGCQWKALPKSFGKRHGGASALSTVARGGLRPSTVAGRFGGIR